MYVDGSQLSIIIFNKDSNDYTINMINKYVNDIEMLMRKNNL